jgi:predicted MFS family arabinose efflux permease
LVLPMRSWFTELCPRPRLATELGRLSARFALGYALLGLLGGPALLWLIGPVGLLAFLGVIPLIIWGLLRPAPPDYPAASERAAAGQGRPDLLWIAAPCGIAASMASSANAAFMPQLVIELGWPTLAVGVLLCIQGTAAVLLARAHGAVVARWGDGLAARAGLSLVIVAALLLYLVPGAIVLPIVALLCGMSAGTLPVIAMTLAARALPSRSRGISIHETYISLGLGAGPFLGGFVIGFLATPRAALLACLVVAAAGLVLVSRRRSALDPSPPR